MGGEENKTEDSKIACSNFSKHRGQWGLMSKNRRNVSRGRISNKY